MDGSEVLHAAGALVASGWCQGAEARTGLGEVVDPRAPDAVRWSLLGALQSAYCADAATQVADMALAAAAIAHLIDDHSLANWNDAPERTQRDVVELLADGEQLAARHLVAQRAANRN
jgi:hypothetical protein